MSGELLKFKSHIEGKNSDVVVYADRIEWTQEGRMGAGSKLALGAATAGLSLLKTGIKKSQHGSEVIPVKSISSVTTEKDGLRFTKVRIICTGNTIDFRVSHDDAKQIKVLMTSLVLGNHPAQQGSVVPPPSVVVAPAPPVQEAAPAPPPPAPIAPEPDVMEQIRKLGELKDAGHLSEEEFAAKKADLLDRL